MSEKKTYVCQYCEKIYKYKNYYKKHVEICKETEIEAFNYLGLIEHWKDIDPDIAQCFEVELEKLLKHKR
jgi:hypothetical protein